MIKLILEIEEIKTTNFDNKTLGTINVDILERGFNSTDIEQDAVKYIKQKLGVENKVDFVHKTKSGFKSLL